MSYSEQYERVKAFLLRQPSTTGLVLNSYDYEELMDWLRDNMIVTMHAFTANNSLCQNEMVATVGGQQLRYDDEAHCREVAMLWALKPVVVHSYTEDDLQAESGRGVVVGNVPDCDTWTEAVIVQGSGFLFQTDDMFVAELDAKDEGEVLWTASKGDRARLNGQVVIGADWWCVRPQSGVLVKSSVDQSRYPHVCSRCGKPAYIGFASTECSDQACK